MKKMKILTTRTIHWEKSLRIGNVALQEKYHTGTHTKPIIRRHYEKEDK